MKLSIDNDRVVVYPSSGLGDIYERQEAGTNGTITETGVARSLVDQGSHAQLSRKGLNQSRMIKIQYPPADSPFQNAHSCMPMESVVAPSHSTLKHRR